MSLDAAVKKPEINKRVFYLYESITRILNSKCFSITKLMKPVGLIKMTLLLFESRIS